MQNLSKFFCQFGASHSTSEARVRLHLDTLEKWPEKITELINCIARICEQKW